MSWKNYGMTCAGLAAVWVIGLLAIPAFAQLVEGLMLLFLSTQAR